MLEVAGLVAGYGRIDVLRDVTLSVPLGSIVGVLGTNGAGKTTLARTVSGLTTVRAGRILLDGRSIQDAPPERIVAAGLVQVPQGRMLFPDLTVAENLEVGAYLPKARREFRRNLERVESYFPVLGERRRQAAGLLSGGEQQMLAIGRALMSAPRLLVLDEPSLGLAPRTVRDIFRVIRQINGEGVTIVVAEQNAHQVLAAADRVYVLESGRVTVSGTGAELRESADIRRTYLGVA
ncbi:MAG: ABC transporter ATP-binding protein [Candidatus Rokuibacteriota bacterium]